MEEESILDPLNELHLMGLHFVYVPLVNKKLNLWQSAWAHHRMRTTRSTPAQMWLTGQINHPMRLDLTSIPLQDCEDSEDELGGNEEQLQGDRPVFLPLDCPRLHLSKWWKHYLSLG